MRKKSVFIFSFFLLSAIAKAQEAIIPQPNGNIVNNSLNKFSGIWVWADGADTVKILLRKENILLPFPENSRADAIVGFHIYKRGADTVESSIEYANSNYADKHSTILGGNSDENDTLNCSLKDLSKNKLGSLTLILVNNQTQLKWELKNSEGVRLGNFVYAFTLPRSIILSKQ